MYIASMGATWDLVIRRLSSSHAGQGAKTLGAAIVVNRLTSPGGLISCDCEKDHRTLR